VSSAKPLIIILGPTASGKTNLAVQLAHHLAAEIISADSRQVFRGMDIGTGKDLSEYIVRGSKIPHHLIDIKDAGEKYNVNEFKDDFYKVFDRLSDDGILPILCGGTGMYIHSLLQNQIYTAIPKNESLRLELESTELKDLKTRLRDYPHDYTKHADQSSHKRLIRAIEVAEFLVNNELIPETRTAIAPIVIGLSPDLPIRRTLILERLHSRLNDGLISEVEDLIAKGLSNEMLEYYGLEYKFVGTYLRGELDFNALNERLGVAICQYAKRQMTFFRKMEKDGVKINWFDPKLANNELLSKALTLINAELRS
jgi:tRNA dimethylallyltransferase